MSFLAVLCGLLILSACGGGSSALMDNAEERGFSLATDSSLDGGTARLGLNVIEGQDSTEVQILATDATELRDLLLHLSYDADRFSPLRQTPSPAMGEEESLLSFTMDRDPGVLHYGVAQIRSMGSGFSGNAVLASLIFENRPFSGQREQSSPPAIGNAATSIDYNNLTGQLSWFYANPGDTNQDGLVNLADLVPIARDYQAAGPFTVDSHQSVADANGDGIVNISDVSMLGANWNNDAFGGFNVYTSAVEGALGSPIGNVAFGSAVGNPALQRLRFSYGIPQGARLAFAWVQPVDGIGSVGLSGDSIFSDIVITGPTASFALKPSLGDGSSSNPYIVKGSESLQFQVFDPEDGDITLNPALSVWLEPTAAGTVSAGMLNISDAYNGEFVMRGSYEDEPLSLLTSKSSSGLDSGNGGDGAFFGIDGCLELRLDSPDLDGNGSIWHPFIVPTAGATLDFSVWHCDLGDISNSEMLSWGWQPENAGEFNWEHKKYTFFNHFTGLWVIEVQWEHEGHFYTDHLYFIVDPDGGNTEATLELKVTNGYEGGTGGPDNPYIICDTTHEVGLKAWHSELGDVTQNEHLFWHVNPENAGVIHPEWHQINISENFLGNFYIEIVWESAGQRLVAKKYFKVQECEPGAEFQIKVLEGIDGGMGTQEHPYEVCINEVHEIGLKAWHSTYGDVTNDPHTTWSWTPEGAGQIHPDWHQFNLAEGFTGNFSIHAVFMREGVAWEDTKHFKALECSNTENHVEIVVFSGVEDGTGTQENPYIICNTTLEFGVKGWHSKLENITNSEFSHWIVDSPSAGVMHPEWQQFNLSENFLGNFAIKLVYESNEERLENIKFFKVIVCNDGPHLSFDIDLEAEAGNGTQESPFKFCQGVDAINFQVFHSSLGEITFNENLSWSTEPLAAGTFNVDLSRFVVNYEYLGAFHVTCTYSSEGQTLTKTLWFRQIECEFPGELVLIVTNPPELGDGTAEHPYVYPQNPIEIGLKFMHPTLGDITDNESVIWGWNPENAGEFRPQWNDFRVNEGFIGNFWISAGWPTEGGTETRKVYITIGNDI
jgi:hypothetical protein